jgi:beta-glucosidase
VKSTPLVALALLTPLLLALPGCGDDSPAAPPSTVAVPICDAPGAAGAAAALASPACESNPAAYAYPFWDPCLPVEERLANLLSTLTIDEKLTLLASNHLPVPRISLPPASLGTEALHGLGISSNPTAGSGAFMPSSTQFPQVFGLGESWDPELMKTVGATTGYEARVYNARGISETARGTGVILRGPNVDLVHDPRWGRTEESFGEDPYLVGEMAKGYLAGLHGSDPRYLLAACTLKHFAANSNETTRMTSSSNLDARNLHEYYAATFRSAVRDGRADGIMTAYNQINGIPAGVSPILKSIVQRDWGFDGFFSTDGQAATHWVEDQHYYETIEEAIAAAIGPGASGVLLQSNVAATVKSAWSAGLLTEADVDGAIGPALRIRFRTGDFDPPAMVPYKQIQSTETPWSSAESIERARDVTRRTVVLLKNADGMLPLERTALSNVAVIGPRADSVERDWYGGTMPYPAVTGRQGIVNKLGPGVTVTYVLNDNGRAATAAAAAADAAIVFVGNHPTCGGPPYPPWGTCASPYEGREQVDRIHLGLAPEHLALVQSVAAVNPRTIVVLVSSFPVAIGWLEEHVPAIVHVSNSSQELGNAVADVLFGDFNPAGRTTTTWYQSEADIPTEITDYDIKKGTTYWYFTGTPLYPFGHGLSYARFEYANLTVSADALPATCAAVDVGVDVTNTSAVAGDEVVQLYIAYPDSNVLRPRQQLRGFKRVNIAAGATAHVTLPLTAADVAYWNEGVGQFTVETGRSVELQIGASSRDIRLRGTIAVTQ